MNLCWGNDLWDRLDQIINHSNLSSTLIDKSYRCFIDCHNVWNKAALKQKRILEKLQTEIKESTLDEFSLTTSILGIINNLTSICNIESTFQDSVAKTSDEYLKKSHSLLKKQCSTWAMNKKRMEDDLFRERRKYEMALKRYRDKYQAMVLATEALKKTEDNRALSRSQVDMCQNSLYLKRNEYDESKRDYAVEITNFNNHQQTYFTASVLNWAKKGEELYDQKLTLLKSVSNDLEKFTKEMVKNLNYSISRFTDIVTSISFEKDAILLVQKYKTGDVPPGELQFIDLDNKQYSSKQAHPVVTDRKESEGSSVSGSGSSTSSFETNPGMQNHSLYSGSYSSIQMSTNTRSEPGRPSIHSVHNIKMRNTGKIINPEATFSFRKSNKIFRSSTPWKANSNAEKAPVEPHKSMYVRRGRSKVKENRPQQRSHSVSEMISNVFRSSLRLKSSDEINIKPKKTDNPPAVVTSNVPRQDSSDFDTDSSNEETKPARICVAPEIVSTPADAVAMVQRQQSVPDYSTVDYRSLQNSNSEPSKETNAEDDYEYSFVGSCTSCHDYDSGDVSNNYLSFKVGDQFYILIMDEGTGWLFVETVDRKMRGYVPTSYMEIEQFDKVPSEDVI